MSPTVIVGNLTADPELRWSTSGTPRCLMRIAVERRWRQGNDWVSETDFLSGVAWGRLAENICETMSKGERMIWVGNLQTRSWDTKEGERRTVTEISVKDCGPSLRWATADVMRNPKQTRSSEGPF